MTHTNRHRNPTTQAGWCRPKPHPSPQLSRCAQIVLLGHVPSRPQAQTAPPKDAAHCHYRRQRSGPTARPTVPKAHPKHGQNTPKARFLHLKRVSAPTTTPPTTPAAPSPTPTTTRVLRPLNSASTKPSRATTPQNRI